MPSGAKKRKAAKKKKENQSNNTSAPSHPHGDEDRESDVGENNSPKSENHKNLPTEGEEEDIAKEIKLPNLPSAEGLRIDGGEIHVEVSEIVVPAEREFKIEDESDEKHGSIEHDEVSREHYNGGSSLRSSSSSSLDGENQGINYRKAESSVNSTNSGDSVSVKSIEATCNSPINEAGDSVVRDMPSDHSEKVTLLNEQMEVDKHHPADISEAPPCVVETTIKEIGEKKLSLFEDKISESVASIDAALERMEESIVESDAKTATVSDPKECVTRVNDDRTALSYNAPRASTDNGAEHVKDSVVAQRPVLAPPFPVQKTSWKSCCGLFEVFSGSGA